MTCTMVQSSCAVEEKGATEHTAGVCPLSPRSRVDRFYLHIGVHIHCDYKLQQLIERAGVAPR